MLFNFANTYRILLGATFMLLFSSGLTDGYEVGNSIFTASSNTDSQAIFTFTPTDDAYIQEGNPDKNYGGSSELQIDDSPAKKHFFIKFKVSGIDNKQITNTILRLYNTNASGKGGDFYYVHDNSWDESTITWNNAPNAYPVQLASLGSVNAESWHEVNITSVVTGDGWISFRITSTSDDGAFYNSKEGGFSPKLIIMTQETSSTQGLHR